MYGLLLFFSLLFIYIPWMPEVYMEGWRIRMGNRVDRIADGKPE